MNHVAFYPLLSLLFICASYPPFLLLMFSLYLSCSSSSSSFVSAAL